MGMPVSMTSSDIEELIRLIKSRDTRSISNFVYKKSGGQVWSQKKVIGVGQAIIGMPE